MGGANTGVEDRKEHAELLESGKSDRLAPAPGQFLTRKAALISH